MASNPEAGGNGSSEQVNPAYEKWKTEEAPVIDADMGFMRHGDGQGYRVIDRFPSQEKKGEPEKPEEPEAPTTEKKPEPDWFNWRHYAMPQNHTEIKPKEEAEEEPLVAVGLNANQIADAWAREQAEQRFHKEMEKAGFFKKIWKGNYAKDYYLTKYQREARADLSKLDKENYQSTLDRFEMSVVKDFNNMVHTKAGEKVFKTDEKTTGKVKELVAWYATSELTGKDLKEALDKKVAEMQKLLCKGKSGEDARAEEFTLDNYKEVLEKARDRVDHGKSIENVLKGFKVINGIAVEGARTEAHRGKLETLANKWGKSKLGRLISPEAVVAVASVATYLTQTGVSKAASIALPIGGSLVAGAAAGIRESGHVKEDIANAARDRALGRERQGTKYDRRVLETLQDMKPANRLTEDINKLIDSDKLEDLQKAVFNAQAKIDFSDANKFDLLAYSSPEKSADERMKLDEAIGKAVKKLKEKGVKLDFSDKARDMLLANELNDLAESKEVTEKAFAKLRRKQIAKQVTKTAAISMGTMILSQEVAAFFDKNSVGLIENALDKQGVISAVNNEGARNTMLGGIANNMQTKIIRGTTTKTVNYEPTGDKVNTGTFWNNNTTPSDKNELNLYWNEKGALFESNHIATAGNQSLPCADIMRSGKGCYVLGVNGKEIILQADPTTGMAIDTPDGILEQCRKSGNFDYLRAALLGDKAADGTQNVESLATVVGNGVRSIFQKTVQVPTISTTQVPRETILGGFMWPFVKRKNLSSTKERETESTSAATAPINAEQA